MSTYRLGVVFALSVFAVSCTTDTEREDTAAPEVSTDESAVTFCYAYKGVSVAGYDSYCYCGDKTIPCDGFQQRIVSCDGGCKCYQTRTGRLVYDNGIVLRNPTSWITEVEDCR